MSPFTSQYPVVLNSLAASRYQSTELHTVSVFQHFDWRPTEQCVLWPCRNWNCHKKEWTIFIPQKSNLYYYSNDSNQQYNIGWFHQNHLFVTKNGENKFFWQKKHFHFSDNLNIWKWFPSIEQQNHGERAFNNRIIYAQIYAVYVHLLLKVTLLPPSGPVR